MSEIEPLSRIWDELINNLQARRHAVAAADGGARTRREVRLNSMSAMSDDPNVEIKELVDAWCERHEYGALAKILPAWLANSGLTDGWAELRDALKHAYATCIQLPNDERDALKRLHVEIDDALRKR